MRAAFLAARSALVMEHFLEEEGMVVF